MNVGKLRVLEKELFLEGHVASFILKKRVGVLNRVKWDGSISRNRKKVHLN